MRLQIAVCLSLLMSACGMVDRVRGSVDLSPDSVRPSDSITYGEACGDQGGAGILIDFNPDWEDVVAFLPDSTRSIWAAPDGYIASSRRDQVTLDSVVGKFRLDEGRVISCDSS